MATFLQRFETMSSRAADWNLPANVAQVVCEWASYIPVERIQKAGEYYGEKLEIIAAPLIIPTFFSKMFSLKDALTKQVGGERGYQSVSHKAATVAAAGGSVVSKGASLLSWAQNMQLVAGLALHLTALRVVGAVANLFGKTCKLGCYYWAREQDCVDLTHRGFEFVIAALKVATLFACLEIQLLMLILNTVTTGFDWFA